MSGGETRVEYRLTYTLPGDEQRRVAQTAANLAAAEQLKVRYETDRVNLPGAVYRIEARTVTTSEWVPA